MTKKQIVDSHIKKLLKKIDNENVDWFYEKKNLISILSLLLMITDLLYFVRYLDFLSIVH